jgi:hypothetical protein
MIFLIEYDRPQGQIVTFRSFDDSDRARAEGVRLDIELALNRKGMEHEVVLLEAVSEDALRRTHRRYFEKAGQIVKSTNGGVQVIRALLEQAKDKTKFPPLDKAADLESKAVLAGHATGGIFPKLLGKLYGEVAKATLDWFADTVVEMRAQLGLVTEDQLRGAFHEARGIIFTEARGHLAQRFPRNEQWLIAAAALDEESVVAHLENRAVLTRLTRTEAGSDNLDRALSTVRPHFAEMRRGAWRAFASGQPDSVRHAAHSGRELLSQILHALAPDDEVRVQPWFQPERSSKSGITRRQRARLAMEKRGSGTLSDKEFAVAAAATDLVYAIADKMNAEAHAQERLVREQVAASLNALEAVLRLLLPA